MTLLELHLDIEKLDILKTQIEFMLSENTTKIIMANKGIYLDDVLCALDYILYLEIGKVKDNIGTIKYLCEIYNHLRNPTQTPL